MSSTAVISKPDKPSTEEIHRFFVERIQPSGNRLLVYPDDPPETILALPDGSQARPISGTILAVGHTAAPEYRPGRCVTFGKWAGNEYTLQNPETRERWTAFVITPEEVELFLDGDGDVRVVSPR